jgi:hypothetical protein
VPPASKLRQLEKAYKTIIHAQKSELQGCLQTGIAPALNR